MYCRNCGENGTENSEYCLKCGYSMLNGHSYCQNCGGETNDLQELCLKCGVRLKSYEIKKNSHIAKSNNQLQFQILFFLSGSVALFGLLAIFGNLYRIFFGYWYDFSNIMNILLGIIFLICGIIGIKQSKKKLDV